MPKKKPEPPKRPRGRPRLDRDSSILHVRCSPWLIEMLRARAEREERYVWECVEEALRTWIAR